MFYLFQASNKQIQDFAESWVISSSPNQWHKSVTKNTVEKKGQTQFQRYFYMEPRGNQ